MASGLVPQLVDSGIHFGHRVSRWNPKMSPYIFGKRNGIHVIDIRETVKGLLRARRFLSQLVAKGQDVLFVGTKRQARQHIRQQSVRVGMPFVAERWLGGTLTNFRTIRSRLARLDELEAAEADGTTAQYSKKMIASRTRELRKIRRNLEGIRKMNRLPGAVVVIDVHRERNAVCEAKKMGIPTVCLIDTDSDPDYADVPIPGNDDAMRAIETVLTHLADAIEEGLKGRTIPMETVEVETKGPRRRFVRPVPGHEGEGVPAGTMPAYAGHDAEDEDERSGPRRPASPRSTSTNAPESDLTPASTSDRETTPQ